MCGSVKGIQPSALLMLYPCVLPRDYIKTTAFFPLLCFALGFSCVLKRMLEEPNVGHTGSIEQFTGKKVQEEEYPVVHTASSVLG